MSFTLPELPYPLDALAPYISEEQMRCHYLGHHQEYVNTLNTLVAGTKYKNMSLRELIKESPTTEIRNNALQVLNHTMMWDGMTPYYAPPSERMTELLTTAFGGLAELQARIRTVATTHFGSGYCWLALDGTSLVLVETDDAENPMTQGLKPILCCDLWEHGYYVDCRNDVEAFVDNFWKVVNWKQVEALYLA